MSKRLDVSPDGAPEKGLSRRRGLGSSRIDEVRTGRPITAGRCDHLKKSTCALMRADRKSRKV
jgi:hypothetical protein